MYAPFFDAPPSLLRKPDGSVLFECICSGSPQPTIQWFFKDQELKDARHEQKIKKSVGKWTVTMIMKVSCIFTECGKKMTNSSDSFNNAFRSLKMLKFPQETTGVTT
ncbi:hypothetical protein Y032_0044g1012 [Ancylostoma ceylanicum]|uniref:Immunoglobulin I-set domain-containing protein n=1 Tax=Ancylostoma ceylanicum TaxID=53326 RepID=A0A016UDE7_9BILA|nr:hypothetical protein Y032_0044g1012 [Ancylostoma ceylanicum]